jgi:type IV pilus assembly protein PilP
MRASSTAALVVALFTSGCDSADPDAVLTQQGRRASGAGPSVGAAPVVTPAAPPPTPTARVYRDSDFVESEQNRDPFRSYEDELRAKVPVAAQRLVLMPETPIDEMRLIAIISGIEQPRAMIVDERGVGYVTSRGDFVGRADVVQGGGSESLPVALNWRIDRIRVDEVVLAREDPSAPGRAPLTRVISLNPDPEGTKDNG